jgi:hypothetical protein
MNEYGWMMLACYILGMLIGLFWGRIIWRKS